MPHPVDIEVGKKIRSKRISIGLTQTELANQLGISFQQIQKYESGANRVVPSKLYGMSLIFETNMDYFFAGLKNKAAPQSEEPEDETPMRLMASFNKIKDKAIRQHIVKLVASISDKEF